MEVGVRQFGKFMTGGTYPATVGFTPVAAGDILGISQGKPQLSGTLRPRKELRMADPLLLYRPDQPLPDFFLTNDLSEKHDLRLLVHYSSRELTIAPDGEGSKIGVLAGIFRLFVH